MLCLPVSLLSFLFSSLADGGGGGGGVVDGDGVVDGEHGIRCFSGMLTEPSQGFYCWLVYLYHYL